ncbi:hypothetical protein G7061_08465 [Erysipelothrix sp. HDW6B]|uniref:B3/B4 domain-containing protein n=1 Tax=Erysipelothrix sp. HDW6B TaxID=2714929 RepID=UPI0014092485|nr:phenylalanine--tRNA ligase beta subunit-related protein [Erysipelothrix sp. HDW6B]QIK86641.1 hypothetical protein G7061_08465 [Erysipelothrix sp. HDW6B]
MKRIQIDKELKEIVNSAALLVIEYEVDVEKSNEELICYLESKVSELNEKYTLADLAELKHIKDTRTAYRLLGKSPSAYRNAAEAMLRRIVKGNGLYQINNVVEVNNIISVSTGYSVGSYDLECLEGALVWKKSPEGEVYKGIGKADVNIEFLPTLYDDLGAFGNPTSDSRRAMINEGKRKIMTVIYSFSGTEDLENLSKTYTELLNEYSNATSFNTYIVE